MCRFIILREESSCTPMAVQDILRFEAQGSYTLIFFINGTSAKQCGHLGEWLEKVKTANLFVRIERSHVVNHLQIKDFSKTGGALLKDNKTRLPVSVEGFIELLGIFR